MQVEFAVPFGKVQVDESGDHPEPKVYGEHNCAYCGRRLQGHGWRIRSYLDAKLRWCPIWVHRRRCPGCERTTTILPSWVHIFKQFSVETILETLSYRITKGVFPRIAGLSGYVQRMWWRPFIARHQHRETFVDSAYLSECLRAEPGGCIARTARVFMVKQLPMLPMEQKRFGDTHQRLYLYVSSVP